jgi:hypothetical protein
VAFLDAARACARSVLRVRSVCSVNVRLCDSLLNESVNCWTCWQGGQSLNPQHENQGIETLFTRLVSCDPFVSQRETSRSANSLWISSPRSSQTFGVPLKAREFIITTTSIRRPEHRRRAHLLVLETSRALRWSATLWHTEGISAAIPKIYTHLDGGWMGLGAPQFLSPAAPELHRAAPH